MIICELCGSANVETDEFCRVCGQALSQVAVAAAPVANQAAAPAAAAMMATSAPPGSPSPPPVANGDTGWPAPLPPSPSAGSVEVDATQRSLQMSAYSAPVDSAAPPMLGGTAATDEPPVDSLPGSDVPSFMQPGGRGAGSAPEPVQLISANDLPEWLRQIADADAAKAEADAAAHAAHSDAPATIVKKALPGETMGAKGTTNWLSKSTGEGDSPDHWDSSEIANANWGNPEPAPQAAPAQEYPSIIPPTAFVPSSTETYSTPKSKRKLSFSKSGSPSTSDKPFYRNQTVQLAFLVVLVAILAMLLLT